MTNIGHLMKQAQKFQEKIEEAQKKIQSHTEEGMSGGGLVHVVINGRHDIQSLKIDPSLVKPEDVGILEDLIRAAYNDAKAKMESYTSTEMSNVSGGLPGGFKLPF